MPRKIWMTIMTSYVGQKVRKKLNYKKTKDQVKIVVMRKMKLITLKLMRRKRIKKLKENTAFPHYSGSESKNKIKSTLLR